MHYLLYSTWNNHTAQSNHMISYANLEQRMAHTYLDMLPPFVPLMSNDVSVHSQEQFYGFIKNMVQVIFDSPELLVTQLHEDDAYPNRFNRAAYGKPKLYYAMKKTINAIEELIFWLYSIGQSGIVENEKLIISDAVKSKKNHIQALPYLGLTLDSNTLSCAAYDGLFPAWKWMAERKNSTAFGRGMFDPQYPYIQDVYAKLFGDEKGFNHLLEYLAEHGYQRFEIERGPYTLDYVKSVGNGDSPLGSPLHGDHFHYGISAEYKHEAVAPQFMVLRILEMKDLLLKFDQMESHLKDFVIQYAKKCDLCRYCTQTDKTGKRKELAIPVTHGTIYNICPLYPGFNFCFSTLDEPLSNQLMAFLDFMDEHIMGKYQHSKGKVR